MLKSMFFFAALSTVGVSSAAVAEPTNTQTFVHNGISYSYTVEQKDKVRILRGKTGRNGASFVLYVTDRNVSGTMNGRPVSFPLNEVKPLTKPTVIASQ